MSFWVGTRKMDTRIEIFANKGIQESFVLYKNIGYKSSKPKVQLASTYKDNIPKFLSFMFDVCQDIR